MFGHTHPLSISAEYEENKQDGIKKIGIFPLI
jgi:hypothetical protein